MLLPAAGLIIAAAPATERRRCRGRPPAVPVLAVPDLPAPAPPWRRCGSHFQANFRNSISWGPIGQGLISWWGPCPLEVPGRPKCGQGPRHKSRPCPSEHHGGAVLRAVKPRRGQGGKEAHRMAWSVNGVISHRGPFTLEVHRCPFCGNGVGHEITPFTPEPPERPKCGQNPKPGSRDCPVGGL